VYQKVESGRVSAARFIAEDHEAVRLGTKTKLLLLIFLLTFISMITGIILFDWWCVEMSALFLGAAILIALVMRMHERAFVYEFAKGMESLLMVALLVGLARGVTIVLNSILFYASHVVQGIYPTVFIVLVMLFYFLFSVPVTSSSGMAVLTMPIIGALAIMMNIPVREVVNAYLFGIGMMYLITPTGSIFPALMMVDVDYKAWLKFIMPFIVVLMVLSTVFLMIGFRY
jgi:uncharacterized ion transporter superfamily protein YfcC